MTLGLMWSDIPAVVSVATIDQTSRPIDPDLLVETFVPHVHVEVGSSLIGFSCLITDKARNSHCTL
jgi:hypothetical protein